VPSTFFLSSPSLNDHIKFFAMCQTQNTWLVGVSCHPFCGSSYALFINTCLSEMKHMFACGVTCCLRFFKKKLHASLVLPSTIAKAKGNILLFPSCATANNNVPLYLPYNVSVVAAVEGAVKINTGELVSLSEQQLVDCDEQNSGCGGGNMDDSFKYIIQTQGIVSETDLSIPGR